MRAVTFAPSGPRALVSRMLGRLADPFLWGPLSGLRLRSVELPSLPGDRWVHLEVLKAGISADDLERVRGPTEPFASFPAVPGHEILARVSGAGPAVRGVELGQRVVVDPLIDCRVRGREPDDWCRSCRAGLTGSCDEAGGEGPLLVGGEPLAPGTALGSNRSLPGGWGEALLAHESQLHPVPEVLDDRTAVLIEPLSAALHAVLQAPPREGEPVLVLGGGTPALATAWALRATGFQGDVVVRTDLDHELRLARLLGASEVIGPGEAPGGHFPLIYDRGQAVRSAGYGPDTFRGTTAHTFTFTRDLLLETPAPVQDLVTHVFPLKEYARALSTAASPERTGSVKVLLDPNAE